MRKSLTLVLAVSLCLSTAFAIPLFDTNRKAIRPASERGLKTPPVRAGAGPNLLTWNTFGNTGLEASEPSVSNDSNISNSSWTLGPGVTGAGNVNRFGGNAWFDTGDTNPTTLAEAIVDNDYLEFTVTPNPGVWVTPTSLVFNWERSNTGPPSVTLRSSADGFATDLGSVTGMPPTLSTNNTINIAGLTNVSGPLTFRLYGYGGTGTTGTGGFDTTANTVNVTLTGVAFNPCDFCNLQFPATIDAEVGSTTPQIFGRIFEAGVTESAGDSGAIAAEVGFGPQATDPSSGGWVWTAATYNAQVGNDDEYVGTFVVPVTPGTYSYTYRYSLDGGTNWTYADLDGNGSNPGLSLDVNQLGTLTVSALIVTTAADTNDGVCDSDCSLREAIVAANANSNASQIDFDIAGSGPHVIQLSSILPALSSDVQISNAFTFEQLTVRGEYGTEQYPVFRVSSGVTAIFGFFAIANGHDFSGGGVQNDGNLTLVSMLIDDNHARDEGGGIYNSSTGNLSISGGVISNNTSENHAAGLSNRGVLTMSAATVSGNSVPAQPTASSRGGGLASWAGSSSTIVDATFTANATLRNVGSGGAVFAEDAFLSIERSTFNNNQTVLDGGAIAVGGATMDLEIRNSTFSGNSLTSTGGTTSASAIYIGGGNGSAEIIGATIVNNTSAGSNASGALRSDSATTQVGNTLIANNTYAGGSLDFSGSMNSLGFNLIENLDAGAAVTGDSATNITGQDPLIRPLANNGGSTQTHELDARSPALDSGSSLGFLAEDQRTLTRPVDLAGYPNAADGSDIGAVEMQAEPDDTLEPLVSSIDDGDADDTVEYGTLLTYTINFNEDINAATVTTADFDNAGTASVTFGAVTEISPGVFTVEVTPTTAGTLILRISGSASIEDSAGNDLTVPITDDTTVNVIVPTASFASISGRTATPEGMPIAGVTISVYTNEGVRVGAARTNTFGNFTVPGLPAGSTYIVSASSRRYTFEKPELLVSLNENVSGIDFTGEAAK